MTNVQFGDDDFQVGFEVALGATYRQAADVGETLATAARIEDGDADSWLHEWTTTAGEVWSAAVAADRAGRPVSALAHYRRAATYYAAALYRVAQSSEPNRQLAIWCRQRACWERIVDLAAGERIAVAYEGSMLSGFFFRAPDARAGERRPLVIINNGSDGATSQAWTLGGGAAGDRGYHWMTFDGPGQQSALFELGITFRPDWENVLTPVLEAMLNRPDVAGDRVAVVGVSQAGYLVTRTLVFEHRFAAAVVDPGVTDVLTSWTDSLPPLLRQRLEAGDRTGFDRELHVAELFTPGLGATLRFRGAPYGKAEGSRFDLYRTVARYRLGDELANITTPLLITDPEGEQFWPGQSGRLYDRLPGQREMITFTAQEGAARHCEPLGSAVRETRIFDWLESYLGTGRPSGGTDQDGARHEHRWRRRVLTDPDAVAPPTGIDTGRVEELRTGRLLLRRWAPEDQAAMARINSEPEVRRYLNRPVDDAAVAGFYAVVVDHWDTHGYGPWALESLEPGQEGRFLGFAGLAHVPPFLAAAGSAPELGWRLDPAFWGRGLATEAAVAARDDALGRLGLPELISIIHPLNLRSQRVAVKIGMTRQRTIENPVLGIDTDVWHCRSDPPTVDAGR